MTFREGVSVLAYVILILFVFIMAFSSDRK